MPKPRLFLIDAHALCYRSFYAIKGLTNSSGQATNAVYGFVNTLRKILRDFHPDYLAVCFDTPAKTHRAERYADYKIQRPKMPDELISQIPLIKEVVRAYRLPVLEVEGYEADDVIASVAGTSSAGGMEAVIVSEDKDMFQLVGPNVSVYHSRKDRMMGVEDVSEVMGVAPELIPDLIGLAGDKVDNIPGVSGIGEVSARKLLKEFGSLEKIYAHLDEVSSPAVKKKLEAGRDMAVLSRELACLDPGVPLSVDRDEMKVGEPDRDELLRLFHELEFRQLANELSREGRETVPEQQVSCVEDDEAARTVCAGLREESRVAFLVKTGEEGDLFDVSSSGAELVLGSDNRGVFRISPSVIPVFRPLLEDKKVMKITFDLKQQARRLQPQNCAEVNTACDVMIAGTLLVPGKNGHDLGFLAWQYLKEAVPDGAQEPGLIRTLLRLQPLLMAELREKGLEDLFRDLEMPLVRVLFKMEQAGVRLDKALLKRLSNTCTQRIEALQKELYEQAGAEFNLNSPKQLSSVLFGKLKLPVLKKTKTGFSTNEEVLQRLALMHPLPQKILEYRQLAKLKSTYIDALPRLVDPATGRVHATFNQTGAETGRLSSQNPNLQNIPIRTELGREIRRAFIASDKKHVLLCADYSQIELRILAHLSKDENLIRAFHQDQDIHTFTASLIFDVPEEEVTPEMRNSAKRVNFGIIYGMSAFGLAKDLSVPQPQAQEFIDKYFLRYPGVKVYMDGLVELCERQGYVMTLMNRRRYIPEINSPNNAQRQFAQRQAINTPVQGSAADLIKVAMLKIDARLQERGLKSQMISTVHDELVFDVPQEETDTMAVLVRDVMEKSMELDVPVRVTLKQGGNWKDMKKVGRV